MITIITSPQDMQAKINFGWSVNHFFHLHT
jgi:hypothetical protein